MRRAILVVIAAACGGSKSVPNPPIDIKPPVVEAPPCAPAGTIELPADGRLRCKELPVSVVFPPGTKLVRQNDKALTLYSAQLEHGAMLLIAEPRVDSPDATRLHDLLVSMIKGIAPDAITTRIDAPNRVGATLTAGVSFTTPDGGAGMVYCYFANHWLVAALVGGRLPETPTRPDKPAAKAFLSSLELQPPVTGIRHYALANGATLDIPAAAWSIGLQPPQDGVRSEEILLLPSDGMWLGIRELEPRDRCDYLKTATFGADDDIAARLKTIYSSVDHPLTHIERAKLGDISVYADVDQDPTHVVMYLICAGRSALQLTVAGEHAIAKLRPRLDEVGRSFAGAK